MAQKAIREYDAKSILAKHSNIISINADGIAERIKFLMLMVQLVS